MAEADMNDHLVGIDAILWTAWDPIGDLIPPDAPGVPPDEYGGYVPAIYALLSRDADEGELAAKLTEFRMTAMAVDPNPSADLRAARKLRAWHRWRNESAAR